MITQRQQPRLGQACAGVTVPDRTSQPIPWDVQPAARNMESGICYCCTEHAQAHCLATGLRVLCDLTNLEEECSNSHGHRALRGM